MPPPKKTLTANEPTNDRTIASTPLPNKQAIQQLLQMFSQAQLTQGAADQPKEHTFWNTQPVPQTNEDHEAPEGPLEPNRSVDQIRQSPFKLPEGYKWVEIDVDNEAELDEVYQLLMNNYVEDPDAQFRFGYPKELLTWALKPPGWKMFWHIGVRVTTSNRLVAFISGVPGRLTVNKTHTLPVAEINFLCVLKKLRAKRMAPVLIKEVTRRCNLDGIFQALFTAGVSLPGAVAKCRYWHRPINVEKLIDVGFSSLNHGQTIKDRIRDTQIPFNNRVANIRKMTANDVPGVVKGLDTFLARFDLHPNFTHEEAKHWFVPMDQVVYSYVAENGDGEIESFVSFYRIPSKVLNHPTHESVNAAYAFYYFYPFSPAAPAMNKKLASTLFNTALGFAKETGHDVFNCLELMDNLTVLKDLKFAMGDGILNYYLYNWCCPPMEGDRIGAVLM